MEIYYTTYDEFHCSQQLSDYIESAAISTTGGFYAPQAYPLPPPGQGHDL